MSGQDLDPGVAPSGFRGEVENVCVESDSSVREPRVDLGEMARRALSYLTNNPLPDEGYQTRFSWYLPLFADSRS